MIATLPDSSFNTLSAQPLSDIILPPLHSEPSPVTPQLELLPEAAPLKSIKERRIFSWSNILIGLTILFLLSTAVYFYWPQTKSQSSITNTANTLLDISQLPEKQTAGEAITHDPNCSGTGSTGSTGKSGSSRNDKPHKSSKPISRSDKPFDTTIGNGAPGDDGNDDEDNDPNRRRNKGEGGPGIYSDAEEEEEEGSEEESLVEDEEEEDEEEGFWMAPPESAGFPNIGVALP